MRKEVLKKGLHDGVPIGLGYFAVSIAFGMLTAKAGLSVFQAGLISLTNVTSAGQFAGLTVMAESGTYLEMALTQLIINLRYCLMSLSLTQKMDPKESVPRRMLMAHGVTDEIFGISSTVPGRLSPFYTYGAMSVAIPGWVLGTVVGAIAGNILPDMIMNAMGLALYGMFLAIIIPPAKKEKSVLLAVAISVALSCLIKVLFSALSSGMAIIIITVAVSALMAVIRPIKEDTEDEA